MSLPVLAPLVQMDLNQLPVSTKPGFLALVNGRYRVQVCLACDMAQGFYAPGFDFARLSQVLHVQAPML